MVAVNKNNSNKNNNSVWLSPHLWRLSTEHCPLPLPDFIFFALSNFSYPRLHHQLGNYCVRTGGENTETELIVMAGRG